MSWILEHTEHRPWPLPARPWRLSMRWTHLAFLHWPVPREVLQRLVPEPLEVDTFDGTGWVGVAPFRMEGTRARGLPGVPTATDFPELNVRTYVRGGGRAGVWFFSLDAGSRLAVLGARTLLNLPYHHALMRVAAQGDEVRYLSRRRPRWSWPGGETASFRGAWAPAGEEYRARPGTLDHWLTERYCLFGRWHDRRVYRMDIHHLPWPLRPGEVEIRTNTMAAAAGIELPDRPPLVHLADRLEVLAWTPVALGGRALLRPVPRAASAASDHPPQHA